MRFRLLTSQVVDVVLQKIKNNTNDQSLFITNYADDTHDSLLDRANHNPAHLALDATLLVPSVDKVPRTTVGAIPLVVVLDDRCREDQIHPSSLCALHLLMHNFRRTANFDEWT